MSRSILGLSIAALVSLSSLPVFATVDSCESCVCSNPRTGGSWPIIRDVPDGTSNPSQYCRDLNGTSCGGANCPGCTVESCRLAPNSGDCNAASLLQEYSVIGQADSLLQQKGISKERVAGLQSLRQGAVDKIEACTIEAVQGGIAAQ